jgi:hypothetical protein
MAMAVAVARPGTAQGTILQITTSTLPVATIDTDYAAQIDTVFGVGPYTWRYFVGDFGTICDNPALYGLTLDTPTTTSYTSLHGHVPPAAPIGTATFCIGAETATGFTPIQTITMPVTHPEGTPMPPARVEIASVRDHQVTLRWLPPASGPPPTAYLLEGGTDAAQMVAASVIPAGRPAATFTLPDGTWFVRVTSLATLGRSVPSSPLRIALGTNAFPGPPTSLHAVVSGQRVALSWTPAFDAGPIVGSVIDVVGNIAGLIPVVGTDGWVFDGVPPGTYAVAVRSRTAAGVGAASAPVVVSVPGACTGAPDPPEHLLVFDGGGSLSAIWNPPSTGAAVESYLVTVTGSFVATVDVGRQRVHDVPIAPGSYTLSITAINACGASAPTPPATAVIR